MSKMSERIKAAREARGLNQSELARSLGLSPQAVQKWEAGDSEPRGSRLQDLARVLAVKPAYLAGLDDDGSPVIRTNIVGSPRPITAWENEDELEEDLYVFIPRLDVKASCGDGKLVWEIDEHGQRNAFRRKWAERLGINPDNSATIVAEGDSMEPRIVDGDSVVIDYKQKNIQDGKIYALAWQGEFFIKRVLKEAGGVIVLHSDNPAYPDKRIPAEFLGELEIIGQAVAISGGL